VFGLFALNRKRERERKKKNVRKNTNTKQKSATFIKLKEEVAENKPDKHYSFYFLNLILKNSKISISRKSFSPYFP